MNKIGKLMVAIMLSLVTLLSISIVYGLVIPSFISADDTLSVMLGILILIMSTVIFILPIWFCIKLFKRFIKEFK